LAQLDLIFYKMVKLEGSISSFDFLRIERFKNWLQPDFLGSSNFKTSVMKEHLKDYAKFLYRILMGK